MHLRRWLTGIIAVPFLIYIIGPGPRWLFQGFMFLAATIALLEFLSIVAPDLPSAVKLITITLIAFLFYLICRGRFFMVLAAISLWAIIPLSVYLFAFPSRRPQAIEEIGKVILGLLYICLPISLFVFMDKHPKGNIWIFFLLTVVFLSDTGAFYFGRTFGKHKLYPSISPGKTWEGAVGGLLSSLTAPVLFSLFPSFSLNLSILALTVCLSISGQIGDLAASMLKRIRGVKDSGWILPGHGGLLDRIDGVLFAIPVLYVYLSGWGL